MEGEGSSKKYYHCKVGKEGVFQDTAVFYGTLQSGTRGARVHQEATASLEPQEGPGCDVIFQPQDVACKRWTVEPRIRSGCGSFPQIPPQESSSDYRTSRGQETKEPPPGWTLKEREDLLEAIQERRRYSRYRPKAGEDPKEAAVTYRYHRYLLEKEEKRS